jgi:8-oxo-dGTP pyrophosphatase MutT (NUDIX family)
MPDTQPFGDEAPGFFSLDRETLAKARHAAVLVPVVARPEGASILLTRRTTTLSKHSGQIAFPGGRIEAHDESPIAAALRETREETGIAPEHVEPLGYLDPWYTSTGFRIVPVVGIVAPDFVLAPDPAEVAYVFEVPLGFVLHPDNYAIVPMGSSHRRFYAITWQDQEIWGATAAILRRLCERFHA